MSRSRKNPDVYAMAFGGRGAIRFRAKDYAGALADFRRAVSLDPTLVEQYLNIGALMSQTNRPKEAVEPFREFLRRAPTHRLAPKIRAWLQQHGSREGSGDKEKDR